MQELKSLDTTETNYGEPINHRKILDNNRAEKRRLLRFLRKLQKHNKTHAFIKIEHEDSQVCCLMERFNVTIKRITEEFEKSGKIAVDVSFEDQ